jgi:cytochrome c553
MMNGRAFSSINPRMGVLSVMMIACAAGALAATTVTAQTAVDGNMIVLQGNGHGAPACVSCHGSALQGDAAMKAPAIAGRPVAFILSRLAHYAGPQGHNPLMKVVASSLTKAERLAVAEFISRLPSNSNSPSSNPTLGR